MRASTTLPYHEKQGLFNQLCLIHAINMLVGSHVVDKTKLDQVCETMSPGTSWWNPHRSALGTGNYDVNVAMYVIDELGYNVSFFDKRKSVEEIPFSEGQCSRLLLNVRGSLFLPGSRHWIGYRKISDCWYLLDSKESGPVQVGDVIASMRHHLDAQDHILIVSEKT